jgi:hypothetical protein
MFKKNSWIVALLVALSFSIFFIGCIDPLEVPPPDTDTYTEVELTEFNAWGGNAENQAGWGTDGAKWDSGKKTVKPLGLTVEDFQRAKYLVVEVNDGFPKNGFETIWDSWDADGGKIGDWQQFSSITSGSGVLNPGFGTKEGNIMKLEMAKIIKNYSMFRDSSTAAITLIIQHWGNGGPGACIKSAKLLIPDTPEPIVPVSDITLGKSTAFLDKDFTLSGIVAPDNAAKQRIIWSIIGFLPDGSADIAANWLTVSGAAGSTAYNNSKAALLAKVDFKATTRTVTPAKTITDYSVLPPEDIVVDPAVTASWKLDNVIIATALGKVKVRATILEGGEDDEDFTKDFVINVTDPTPLKFKLGGTNSSSQEWGGAANDGQSTDMEVATDGSKFTIGLSGGYGNSYYYFLVDFGADSSLGNYTGVKFKYKGVADDYNYKTLRIMVAADIDDITGYNPGIQIGETNGSSDVSTTAAQMDAKFNFATNIGANDKVYIWFLPWSNPATFEISEIEFYKDSIPYKVDGAAKTSTEYAAFDNDGQGITGHSYIVGTTGGFNSGWGFGGNNGNSNTWFKVDLGADTLADYIGDSTNPGGIKFKIKGVDEDGTSSFPATDDGSNADGSVRIKILDAMPTSGGYAPGQFTYLGVAGDITTAQEIDAVFCVDERNLPAGTPNKDYNRSAVEGMGDLSEIYVWIYFQPNAKSIYYTVTDIEFYKPETP